MNRPKLSHSELVQLHMSTFKNKAMAGKIQGLPPEGTGLIDPLPSEGTGLEEEPKVKEDAIKKLVEKLREQIIPL